MKINDHYDWIVLGDHPGALLSACLAAKSGLSVLILPYANSARTIRVSSEFVFDPEPRFLLGARGSEGLLLHCLENVGALKEDLFEDSELQILTASKRTKVCSDFKSSNQEWTKEWGAKWVQSLGFFEAVEKLWKPYLSYWHTLPKRLSPSHSKKKKDLGPKNLIALKERLFKQAQAKEKSWINSETSSEQSLSLLFKKNKNDEFLDFILGLYFGVYSTEFKNREEFYPYDFFQAFVQHKTGVSFKGGIENFRRGLRVCAQNLGAHAPEKERCEKIETHAGRFQGVLLSESRGKVLGKGAVLGTSLAFLWPQNLFKKKKRTPSPYGWRMTLALRVHVDGIAEGVADRMVFQSQSAPALEIEFANPSDYGIKKSKSKFIFLRSIVPFVPESLEFGFQRKHTARMFRALTEIMPFVEDHVEEIYPDFRSSEHKSEFSQTFGCVGLDYMPENLRVFNQEGVGFFSGIEGLWVASGESYPLLGSLGWSVAALEATAQMTRKLGVELKA